MLCFLRPDGSKRPKAERDKLSASASSATVQAGSTLRQAQGPYTEGITSSGRG